MRYHFYKLSSLPLLNINEQGRMIMYAEKPGWSIPDWCDATSLGRTKTFELISNGSIRSIREGRRRIIITSPADYFNAKYSGALEVSDD